MVNCVHCNALGLGQRDWAKYRDSENFKAVPRVFYGAKIAPAPPGTFPARSGILRLGRTALGGYAKTALLWSIKKRCEALSSSLLHRTVPQAGTVLNNIKVGLRV
jgi:hypothetical protein